MKTVLITGASRGIGLATSKKFLSEGWRVIGTYNRIKIPITDTHFIAVQYDQGNSDSILQAVKQITSDTPGLDAFINNAAIIIEPSDTTVDARKVRTTFEVNVVGLIDFTERLLSLLYQGSHIVNIGSGYGAFSSGIDGAWAGGYRMSKAAVHMYTRQLAFRLQTQDIIVSALCPGWINTDMGRSLATEIKGPSIEPEQVAKHIFSLVETVKETGFFWQDGKKRDW